MLIPDVNVLINATHSSAPRHVESRAWLESALTRHETVGLLDVVATGYLRIMTNPRIWSEPLSTQEAMRAISAILDSPNVLSLSSNAFTWQIFDGLVRLHKLTAGDIPDDG